MIAFLMVSYLTLTALTILLTVIFLRTDDSTSDLTPFERYLFWSIFILISFVISPFLPIFGALYIKNNTNRKHSPGGRPRNLFKENRAAENSQLIEYQKGVAADVKEYFSIYLCSLRSCIKAARELMQAVSSTHDQKGRKEVLSEYVGIMEALTHLRQHERELIRARSNLIQALDDQPEDFLQELENELFDEMEQQRSLGAILTPSYMSELSISEYIDSLKFAADHIDPIAQSIDHEIDESYFNYIDNIKNPFVTFRLNRDISFSRAPVARHMQKGLVGWRALFDPKFARSIKRTPPELRDLVKKAIQEVLEDPLEQIGSSRQRLTGNKSGIWRQRVRDYRITYIPDTQSREVIFLDFQHRDRIYS